MTMFIAGHETIGTAVTWTWYFLGEHADIEAKLHAELENVLGDRPPGVEDIPRLDYTRKVMLESMRLIPPVWLMVRKPLQDVELCGYRIAAGSYIHMSPYVIHRDPRYYPDPEIFDPERWTPEATAQRPRTAYFPFGMGKRQCIGQAFTMTEGVLILATLARTWRLRRVSRKPVAFDPLITLRPTGGMHMTLEKRTGGKRDPGSPD
jgi:cytochrome P450